MIKPKWGQPLLPNGEANPKFIEEVEGHDIIEGNFSDKQIKAYNDKGYNIYYFPNGASKVKGKFLSGKEIDQYNVVFVDMDLKDEEYESKDAFLEKLAEFPLTPSRIVDSGNGIHAYWNISDLERETYIMAQFSLINHFKTDESVWTPLQLMRVGGYNNTKRHKDYVLAEILLDENSSYTIEKLFEHLEPPTEIQMKKLEKHCAKLDGTYVMPEMNDIDFDTLPDSFINLLQDNDYIRELYQNPKEAIGDRSKADYILAQELFTAGLDLSECVQVIANGSKAKERQDGREYAYNTVEKVYEARDAELAEEDGEFQLLSELLEDENFGKSIGTPVFGERHWDCLETPWQTSQVLGIVAGPGVGKTETTLFQFKNMVQADPEALFVFFSLEMPERQIAKRWRQVIDGDKNLSNSVVVIGNEDKDGAPRNIGIQQVYRYVKRIEQRYGKKVKVAVIDHINILDKTIDTKKEPHFRGETDNSYSKDGKITLNPKGLLSACKQLAKALDVFLIIQSQTTKDKAQDGDVPLGLSAAYGNSAFEWYCDFIITIWQPLRLVHDQTDLKVLAWQYVKIREQDDGDGTRINVMRLLNYDRPTRSFRPLSDQEFQEFNALMPKVNAKRQLKEKKELTDYKNSNILKVLGNQRRA